MMYVRGLFMLLVGTCLGAKDAQPKPLTTEVKELIRGGVLLSLTRGAANDFDRNGSDYDTYLYRNSMMAKTPCCEALVRYGHSFCHNYMRDGTGIDKTGLGELNPYSYNRKCHGGQVPVAHFTKSMEKIKGLMDKCLETSNTWQHFQYDRQGLEIYRHWKKWSQLMNDWTEEKKQEHWCMRRNSKTNKMEFVKEDWVQLKGIDQPLLDDQHEQFLRLGRLMVIFRLSRGVSDFYKNDCTPIAFPSGNNYCIKGAFPRCKNNEAQDVYRAGNTIAHLGCKKLGMSEVDYNLWFFELEVRIRNICESVDELKDAEITVQDENGNVVKQKPFGAAGCVLKFLDLIRDDDKYAELRPIKFMQRSNMKHYIKTDAPAALQATHSWRFPEGWELKKKK